MLLVCEFLVAFAEEIPFDMDWQWMRKSEMKKKETAPENVGSKLYTVKQ